MSDLLHEAENFAEQHDKQVDEGIQKAGDELNAHTGNKYSSAIDKGVNEAQQHTGQGDQVP